MHKYFYVNHYTTKINLLDYIKVILYIYKRETKYIKIENNNILIL